MVNMSVKLKSVLNLHMVAKVEKVGDQGPATNAIHVGSQAIYLEIAVLEEEAMEAEGAIAQDRVPEIEEGDQDQEADHDQETEVTADIVIQDQGPAPSHAQDLTPDQDHDPHNNSKRDLQADLHQDHDPVQDRTILPDPAQEVTRITAGKMEIRLKNKLQYTRKCVFIPHPSLHSHLSSRS